MDLKQIEKLMSAMERSSIKRVVLKQEGFEIELERESSTALHFSPATRLSENYQEVESPPMAVRRPEKEEISPGKYVTSPMVGTFYSSPSPDEPSFVKVGDVVEENTVLCIIEAMKVMNEVKANIRGKIVEILVNSGDPVEFGTNIFRIEA